MKALVMRAPGEYGVEDVKKPVPGFQEVLVRMHSVAICGSDPPLLAGESLKDGLPAYMPFIPGHEGAGVVETRSEERRVGKECRSRWSPYH